MCGNDDTGASNNINSNVNHESDNIIFANPDDIVFEELKYSITEIEILNTIGRLKRGKAHGLDGILIDCIIECKNVLIPIFTNLFNYVCDSGLFPECWSTAIIIPVHKKGNLSDPNNFRAISLISCVCKLFTSVLNARLLKVCENNDILTDAQFGN